MKKITVELTDEQIAQLEPAFDELNLMPFGSAILAQVFRDGLSVKVLPAGQIHKIVAITRPDTADIEFVNSARE